MKSPDEIKQELDKQNQKTKNLRKNLRKSRRLEKQKRAQNLGKKLLQYDSSMNAKTLNQYINNYRANSYYIGVLKNLSNDMIFDTENQKWKIQKLYGFTNWLATNFRNNNNQNRNSSNGND